MKKPPFQSITVMSGAHWHPFIICLSFSAATLRPPGWFFWLHTYPVSDPKSILIPFHFIILNPSFTRWSDGRRVIPNIPCFYHFNQIRCTADIFATMTSSTLTQFIFWIRPIAPPAFFIYCLISKLAIFLLFPCALFSYTSVCLCVMKLSLGWRDSYSIP